MKNLLVTTFLFSVVSIAQCVDYHGDPIDVMGEFERPERRERPDASDRFDRGRGAEDAGDRKREEVIPSPAPTKPSFSNTPLGQDLHEPIRTCWVPQSSPSKNSVFGGLPGYTRSNGTVFHGGFDESPNSKNNFSSTTRYYGPTGGIVTDIGHTSENGYRVSVSYIDSFGIWTSTVVHVGKVLVKVGDKLENGQAIASGIGEGDIFSSHLTGEPHVHWKLERNGERVHPIFGSGFSFANDPYHRNPAKP